MLNERTTGWRWRPVTWVVPSTLALAVATGAPTRAETIHVPGDSTVHESLLPSYGPGKDTVVYNVRAFIDGRSRLTLNDDTARWRHLDNAAPGRWGCPPGRPTIINTVEWFPEWPDAPDCENRNCNCFSDVHEGVTVLRNETPRDVTLTPIECRSSCSIIELP